MTPTALTLSTLTLLCVSVSVTSADEGKSVCLSVCLSVWTMSWRRTIRYDTIRDAGQSALSTARYQLLKVGENYRALF